MANHVEFQDFSFEVKSELNETSLAWLLETGNEIASHAKRNCKMEDDAGKQLKGSYRSVVDEAKGEATVGTPLEAGYWEEFGTGEYADTSKNGGKPGREGWWIYIPGQESMGGGMTYHDEMEAMMMAAHIQSKYGKKAYVTNGRRPNYTLEKAFGAVKNPAIARLEQLMKGRMGT